MWGFQEESKGGGSARAAIAVAVGMAGGLVAGVFASRKRAEIAELGHDVRDGARRLASRIGPARLRRERREQTELIDLEDAVIEACLADDALRDRGIDIGAISPGIIELSGAVATEEEADHAVAVTRQVEGVTTVVNRLEVEADLAKREEIRRRREDGDPAFAEARWGGRNVGMGRMRQGPQTEPDRPDDSQKLRGRALEEADRGDAYEERGEHNGTSPDEDDPVSMQASPSVGGGGGG